MYGTIAKLKVLPGKEAELMEAITRQEAAKLPGFVAAAVYRADAGDDQYWLAVIFDSKESYRANAESPEQDGRYRTMRATLAADPEWNDGEVLSREIA